MQDAAGQLAVEVGIAQVPQVAAIHQLRRLAERVLERRRAHQPAVVTAPFNTQQRGVLDVVVVPAVVHVVDAGLDGDFVAGFKDVGKGGRCAEQERHTGGNTAKLGD